VGPGVPPQFPDAGHNPLPQGSSGSLPFSVNPGNILLTSPPPLTYLEAHEPVASPPQTNPFLQLQGQYFVAVPGTCARFANGVSPVVSLGNEAWTIYNNQWAKLFVWQTGQQYALLPDNTVVPCVIEQPPSPSYHQLNPSPYSLSAVPDTTIYPQQFPQYFQPPLHVPQQQSISSNPGNPLKLWASSAPPLIQPYMPTPQPFYPHLPPMFLGVDYTALAQQIHPTVSLPTMSQVIQTSLPQAPQNQPTVSVPTTNQMLQRLLLRSVLLRRSFAAQRVPPVQQMTEGHLPVSSQVKLRVPLKGVCNACGESGHLRRTNSVCPMHSKWLADLNGWPSKNAPKEQTAPKVYPPMGDSFPVVYQHGVGFIGGTPDTPRHTSPRKLKGETNLVHKNTPYERPSPKKKKVTPGCDNRHLQSPPRPPFDPPAGCGGACSRGHCADSAFS
jgi:hypothetical protein